MYQFARPLRFPQAKSLLIQIKNPKVFFLIYKIKIIEKNLKTFFSPCSDVTHPKKSLWRNTGKKMLDI